MINDKITQYFSLENEINEFFGFKGEWRQFPLNDSRDMHWKIDSGELYYYEEELTDEVLDDGAYYAAKVRRNHVYRKDGLVLVVADTNCDFNIYAYIFDEKKESK